MTEPVRARSAADSEVVAIVPAAGAGTRLGRLPGSKEMFPIGFETAADGTRRPRPVIVHLLDRLRAGGVHHAVVVLRAGKGDVPRYLTDGSRWGLRLAYTVLDESPHVPYTVASALPWVGERIVALGFPDILFRPIDAYAGALDTLRSGDADLVLGLFPTERSEKTDMVELGDDGAPRRLIIKQPGVALRYTWSLAVWRPSFSRWLADWVTRSPTDREAHFGDAVQDALDQGVTVRARIFDDGDTLDVGTPEDLETALRRELGTQMR